MGIIDADTHIDETDDTWEYMTGDDLRFKPTTQYPANPDPTKVPTRYWLIDGRRQLRFIRGDEESGTVVQSRELLDIQVRLKHMDQLGTEIQVIYPTVFLMEASEKPDVASALRRSYNRWLADRCSKSNGRLRWVCLPPLHNMDEAVKELRFAKEHGACGVLKKGDREADKWIADPYFHAAVSGSGKTRPADLHPHRVGHSRFFPGAGIFTRGVLAHQSGGGERYRDFDGQQHPQCSFPNCASAASKPVPLGRRSSTTICVGALHRAPAG